MDYGRRDRASESEWLTQHAASVHRVEVPASFLRRFVSSARALRRIARDCDANLVLTLYGGSLAATAYLSRVRPYVVYIVGSDVLLATSLQKVIARRALSAAATVLANGEHLARSVRGLAPNSTVTPLYLGVDVADYSPERAGPQNLSFVCTRGFLDVYDNATIVRALGLLGEVPPGLTMKFVSSGPLLAETERLADSLIPASWRDRVVFLGGAPHDQLKNIVKSASFYLSASLSDGTSSSLLEAMACGLIPIVTDIAANREWITPGENGLLFAPGDYRGLADQIRRAIDHEPWMAKARAGNRALVEERANAKVNMVKLLDILKRCLQ
jgi:glycosyltransferase involved in cell wall biosynthesis